MGTYRRRKTIIAKTKPIAPASKRKLKHHIIPIQIKLEDLMTSGYTSYSHYQVHKSHTSPTPYRSHQFVHNHTFRPKSCTNMLKYHVRTIAEVARALPCFVVNPNRYSKNRCILASERWLRAPISLFWPNQLQSLIRHHVYPSAATYNGYWSDNRWVINWTLSKFHIPHTLTSR